MKDRSHLVLVGAGHTHLETISAISEFKEAGKQVTVISTSPYQYYSGMGPGLLSGFYAPGDVRFNVRRMVESRGGTFVTDRAASIDADNRLIVLSGGDTVTYDAASFGVGSEIDTGPLEYDRECMATVKPIEGLNRARLIMEKLLDSVTARILVIGGGAAGVEMAANATMIGKDRPNRPKITIISRGVILRQFPRRVRNICRSMLRRAGVIILENSMVMSKSSDSLILETGESVPFHFVLFATGTRPPAIFAKSGMPVGETGGLLVNEKLQCVGHPDVFGGGDCIDFAPRSLAKVGVYAVRQNRVLKNNLLASLIGKPLTAFVPQRRYHLALNMGNGSGISYRMPLMVTGKIAFKLKDAIDRRFMGKFQEGNEPAGDRAE